MILTDDLKIPDNKIEANQAQYDLDRKVAERFPLISGELGKY